MEYIVMCIHKIKKFGRFKLIKYLSGDEIHIDLKEDDEVVEHFVFEESEHQRSNSSAFFNNLCLTIQIKYTLELKQKSNGNF